MSDVVTAQECWDRLVDDGVIRPQDYDADVVDELSAALGIAPVADLRSGLLDVSAQAFIRQLFRVVEPVVAMTSDLLRLYAEVQARQADRDNLRLRFDFDATTEPLDLDLTAFREWEERARRISAAQWNRLWDQRAGWELVTLANEGLRQTSDERVDRIDFPRDAWPSLGSPAPQSGLSDLDRCLSRAWRVREDFLTEVVARWPVRADYREGFWAPDRQVEDLRIMVSDFWDHHVGQALTALAARGAEAARSDDPGLASAVGHLTAAIHDLIDTLPTAARQVELQVSELVSFLSLPMWGKRHELYAAWVCTQIVEGIGADRLAFSVKSGVLSFSFRGVELATLETVDGQYALWAELRSPHANPVGSGRKAAIQPDYRLARTPLTDPASSIMAVEAKQYRRSIRRNPAEALADYTSGLPGATVLLAAYGPISAHVTDGLAPEAAARAHVVPFLRPGRDAEQGEFQRVVASVVPPPPPPPPPRASRTLIAQLPDGEEVLERHPREGAVRIELSWTRPGVDLDLWAMLSDGRRVSYRERIAQNGPASWVSLDADVLRPPGPEVLRVTGPGPVHIAVDAYTGEDLREVGGTLRVFSGPRVVTVPVSPTESGRWCHVVTITAETILVVRQASSELDPDAVAWALSPR